jgi:hypothetical protein
MPSPGSLLRRPAGAIPQGVPRLDPGDPINQRLVGLWLPGVAPTTDFAGRNGTAAPTAIGVMPSRYGIAGVFDGSTSQLDIGTPPAPPGNKIWVSALVNFTGTSDRIIIQRYNYTGPVGWSLEIYSGDIIFYNTNGSYPTYSAAAAGANTWHQIDGIDDGTNLILYVDGVLRAATADGGKSLASGAHLVIGGRSPGFSGNSFGGQIARVALLDRTPLASEIMRAASSARLWPGLVFPGDRIADLVASVAGGGGLAVAAAARLAAEFVAGIGRGAGIGMEAAARRAAGSRAPTEFAAAASGSGLVSGEAQAGRVRAYAVPAEWLRRARGVAATPAEAAAALAAGAVVAVESGGAAALLVSAGARLPVEFAAAATPLARPLPRLLASPGRLRILATPGRRRVLATPGRTRTLKPTDR